MKFITSFLFCLPQIISRAQTKPGTTFNGISGKYPDVCIASAGNFLNEKQVEDMITDMLSKVGARNRYIIVNCTQVENCQAFLFKGKPYILYNPNFLGKVKKLNFSSATLPDATDKDWETLTILAHELGHHINNHLLNPLPDATHIDMELEADETAGFIIYLLGGTLTQVQLAYKDIQEVSSYTHPARRKRLDAVEKGWNNAEKKYPKNTPVNGGGSIPVNPVTNNEPGTVKDIDDNIYNTVQIGSQLWMQSNLNVSHFRNGDIIPEVRDKEEWSAAGENKKPAWGYYENNPVSGKKCGKLYNWYAVTDPRVLAPKGWHIPTSLEWSTLNEFLGEDSAGAKIKTTSGWYAKGNGTNETHFWGFPCAYRLIEFDENSGAYTEWWSSSDRDNSNAWRWGLANFSSNFYNTSSTKIAGFYIRCIKD